MQITIATVTAEGLTTQTAEVPAGATVAQALRAAGVTLREGWGLARWGRRCREEDVLEEGDRLDLASPLLCDPKKARRERAERQVDVRTVTCGRHGSKKTRGE